MSLTKGSSLSSDEQAVKAVGVSVSGGQCTDLEADDIVLAGLSLRYVILVDALHLGCLFDKP